jgi:small glutamine-rich tetratricopeptide repeat-containing protein alpha
MAPPPPPSKKKQVNERRLLVAAIVRYLGEEALIGLSTEDRESVEVAIQCLNSVYETDSVSAAALPNIKVCLNPDSFIEKAAASTATADSKELAESLKTDGNKHLAAGRAAEARYCYQQAIDLNPSNPVFHSNLAAALTALGEYEEAVESSQTAVELDPDYAKAWSRLGTALKCLGRKEEALEAFEQSAQLDPKNEQVRQSIAQLSQLEQQKAGKSKGGAPNIAEMMGGMDINKLMSDPNFMQMANQMVQSGALNDLLKDPSAINNIMKNMKR